MQASLHEAQADLQACREEKETLLIKFNAQQPLLDTMESQIRSMHIILSGLQRSSAATSAQGEALDLPTDPCINC